MNAGDELRGRGQRRQAVRLRAAWLPPETIDAACVRGWRRANGWWNTALQRRVGTGRNGGARCREPSPVRDPGPLNLYTEP